MGKRTYAAPNQSLDIVASTSESLNLGNNEIEIYRYVTEGSFDAFMWQTLETKARFIAQAMAGDAGTRRADDIGGAELSFAEVKAIATGNPALLVLAEMDLELRQLTLLRKAHLRDQAKIAAAVQQLPAEITKLEQAIADLDMDLAKRTDTKGDAFAMTVGNLLFKIDPKTKRTPRQRAQDTLALAVAKAHSRNVGERRWTETLGSLGGLDVVLMAKPDPYRDNGRLHIALQGAGTYKVARIDQPLQCPPLIAKLERTLNDLDTSLALQRRDHAVLRADLERYQERWGNPFGQEATYQALSPLRDRLKTLLRQQENAEGTIPAHEEIRSLVEQFQTMALNAEQPPTQVMNVAPVEAEPVNASMPVGVTAEIVETNEPSAPPESERVTSTEDAVLHVRAPKQTLDDVTLKPVSAPHGQQASLFATPIASPRTKPSARVTRVISGAPVQLGLFDVTPTIEVRAEQPTAKELRVAAADDVEFRNIDDEAIERAERRQHGFGIDDDPEEVAHWQESLSHGERSDMLDLQENGWGASEDAVVGRFTLAVKDRRKLADVVHDAIEHYEPFGSMVERLEREAGRLSGTPAFTDKRGARSLYNATLASRSGWQPR